MKLLIIEDSSRLRTTLKAGFVRMGYAVDDCADGKEGLSYALINEYDVIILDLMLPSMDGLSVLRELRDKGRNTYVLILSAKDQVEDRIKGLNYGADDYMIKPFSFDELHARLLTLTRRKHNIKTSTLCINNITIDTLKKEVLINKRTVHLTPTEYLITEHLALNINRVITYDSMINQIYTNDDDINRNTLEAHISSLRKKLKQAGSDDLIKTKRGFGYYIEKP